MGGHDALSVAKAIVNAINAKDMDTWAKLHADDVTARNPASEPQKGIAEHRKNFEGLLAAFPDLKGEEVRTFAQGEWVCSQWVMSGTHTGPLEGPGGLTFAPTGKTMRLEGVSLMRIAGGKIREEQDFFDLAGMAMQLGLPLPTE